MKVTSIIFLFISIALIIGGMFLMKLGRNSAPNDIAIDGYDYSNDGVITSNISLDEQEISKYSIILNDCEVEITGKSDTSTAVLTNFKPNRYLSSVAGKTYSLSDDISITDYISFDGTGVKFSGVWQTLLSLYNSYKYDNDDTKTVVIKIANASDLNQIKLNLTNCKFRMHDISGSYDLNISGTGSDIELSNINCSTLSINGSDADFSLLNLTTDEFDLTLNGGDIQTSRVTAKNVYAELDGLNTELKDIDFRNLDATVEKGDFSITTNYDMTSYSRLMTAKDGTLYINKVNSGSSFESDKDTEFVGSIVINVEKGDIRINFGSLILLPEDPDTDDTDDTEGPAENPDEEQPAED